LTVNVDHVKVIIELTEGTDRSVNTITGRSGPFWDAVEGRAPLPPAAATLGLEFIEADVANGTIELAFAATEAFTNPTGNVLGAFLAAMLYDTMGPALLATLEPDQFQSTLDLKVSFLRPVKPAESSVEGGSRTGTGTSPTSKRRSPTQAMRPSPPQQPLPGSSRSRRQRPRSDWVMVRVRVDVFVGRVLVRS
jgi:acyl-coenzyme A thioesterase PaaI-like protein